MADEQIVTNIVATSNFSSLIADVQKTTAALSRLQKELTLSNKTLAAQAGQIQKSFGETLRSTGQFTTHFVTVGSEIDTFGKKLDTGKLKLGDYFKTWQNHTKTSGGLIRDLAKQQVALQSAIIQPLGKTADGLMKFNVHVANGLNETANKTALARKELQIYNKVIQDGGVQLINWGKNTQWAGRQLTVGLTVPLAAFGFAAAKAFREADQELVRLTKVYGGLTATSTQDLAKIRKDVSATARELSAAYGSSYKDTISLAADLAATGKQGNDLLMATKEATRLSVLGEVDRQEAMKATLAIQSAFKQNTTELSDSINFLNAVENQTSTSLADLVEAIPKAGPVVKALGGSIQDLALYLTAMREGGINASEGANALKSALASIINPTKVAKDMFAGFGIDLGGIVTKNAGNLTETILGIQAALETLDPLKKSQAIEQLFGKFQFARMNALFENLGKQGSQTLQVLDLMKASSQDLANVAGRELGQITESASGKYKRAIESLKADLAGLGDQFLKVGTFFIKVVDGILKFVDKMPGPVKNLLGLLGGITALAGPLIMLTGVFANFIGYVIKGIGHMRSLGRGGEGFKLLTPQILAAEKAGSLIEKTFYSDAAAAQVLQTALSNLANELTILQEKASIGSVSVQPTLSTIQGNIIAQGTQRVADPNNPLIGKSYSRQMSHLNPVAGMTNAEKAAQTIFGVVPGPGPVNQRIGKNPQIYAQGDLPNVEGLTSIKGVSTGIVSQEAARWHSMTAALAMQSEEEIKLLKREVSATGAITTELSTSYQALLPQMTSITTLAAEESRLIVAELQAGKTTVDQARAKIIALNAQVEVMMSETAALVATSQGRILNASVVPLTGQPVVDPITGKTNMKEMFHKSKTSALVDKIARSLGVRTSGGGYSTHTTIPKRLNSGGIAYLSGGSQDPIVPGPDVNYDVVPAILTPGEFVVNKDATAANLPLLQRINGTGSSGVGQSTGSSGALGQLSADEIRRRFEGRQFAHLTDAKFLPQGEDVKSTSLRMQVAREFGVSREEVSKGTARVNSSFYAAWHAFVNQDSNNGKLNIDKFLAYLNGEEVEQKLPNKPATKVKHDASLAYEAMMADLGVPLTERAAFAKEIDKGIIEFLKTEKAAGKTTLADASKATAGKLSFSKVGEAVSQVINNSGNSKYISNLKRLKAPGDFRYQRDSNGKPGKGPKRIFKTADDRISSVIASIVGKRGMPEVPKSIVNEFPKIKLKANEKLSAAEIAPVPLPRGKPASGPLARLPRRFNSGGIVGRMTTKNVGMIPGYANGGMIRGYERGGKIDPLMAGFGLQIAGQMIGEKNSAVGNSLMFGGLAMQMSPLLGMFKNLSASAMSFTSIFSKLKNIVLMGLKAIQGGLKFMFLNPVGQIILGITALTAAFMYFKDQATKQGEVNRASFGLTGTALEEVGIKYKTVSERIKEVNQQLELNKAKVEASYQTYTKSGVAGLDITLKNLKDGVSNAKKNDKETVGLFDKAKGSQVNELAATMKAQYVSLGMSVQEATNQIYILIKASNKSSQAVKAISSDSFKNISDKASAALYPVNALNKALSTKGLFNAEEFARGLDNMLNSLDAYKKSLMETNKTQVGLTNLESNKKVIEEMNKLGVQNNKLNEDQLQSLKSQNIELAAILGKSETLGSIYAKYQLYLSGASSDINIQSLSIQQAIDTLQGYEITKKAAGTVLAGTQIATDAKNTSSAAKDAKKILDNASKMDDAYINKAIKNKQKLIDKIEEERSARLKIIDLQEKSASFEVEIAQAKLRYQDAIASGNMSEAAQEQLNVQKLTGDREKELAKQAINDKADADRKKIELEIEKLQAQKDAQVSALSSAQTNLNKKQEEAASAALFLEEIKNAIANFAGDKINDVKQFEELLNRMRKEGKGVQVNDLVSKFGSNNYQTGSSVYGSVLQGLKAKTDTELAKPSYDKFDSAVKAFREAVDAFVADAPIDPTKRITPPRGNKDLTSAVAGDVITENGKQYIYDEFGNKYEFTTPIGKALRKQYKKADGGHITGPGTGTSDSIPAMLSNGEYVLKASAVKKYGVEHLDAMNAGRYANGGYVNPSFVPNMSSPAYADGGSVPKNKKWYEGFKTLGKKENWEQTANFFQLPAMAKTASDVTKYGGVGGMMLARMFGAKTKSSIGDNAITAFNILPIPVLKTAQFAASKVITKSLLEKALKDNLFSRVINNIKDAKAWTHYSRTPAEGVEPQFARSQDRLSSYGAGTYGSLGDSFKGAYGEFAHKLSLSPAAWIKTALGKGSLTDETFAKEMEAYSKLTGQNVYASTAYLGEGNQDILQYLIKRGYTGYRTKGAFGLSPDDIVTNWMVGAKGYGLKNQFGKLPFLKPKPPIKYPDGPPGLLLATGGYVNPSFVPNMSSPAYAMGGMVGPKYNIPKSSTSVTDMPFNRYNGGGMVNNYGGITVNPSPGMDEKMLAKYVISEMKRADAISFASQGRPGSRSL
jgi:TP901 family phage tail tape measure protein